VQGNLDPVKLLAGGAGLRRDVEEILATLGEGPFVFNLGHGILPETPPEHVAELVELVQGQGAAPREAQG
jgi:uroporphyrinogen decarboxylase